MRCLQRDVLPARITTCEQAEVLIALDRELQSADPDWRDYLVLTVRDFVVWGLGPSDLWTALRLSGWSPSSRPIAE
jgi:hypothetical protein